MSQGCLMQPGLTNNDSSLKVFQPVTVPGTRKLFERAWTQLFGSLTSDKLAVRVFVDFIVANLVLVMAAVVRLAVMGGLSWDNPVGALFDRVNATYLMNAGWFGLSTVVLFAVTRVYKPVPFSRVQQRLTAIALACGIGLIAHLALGAFAFNKPQQTLEVGLPAWTLLCAVAACVRYSRMKIGEHFRVVPRGEANSPSGIKPATNDTTAPHIKIMRVGVWRSGLIVEKNGEIKPSLLMANKIRVKPYNNTSNTVIKPANTPVATKVDAQV